MQARKLLSRDKDIGAVLSLVQRSFAGMNGRINPPSSAIRLDVEAIEKQIEKGEVWVIGAPPVACIFLTPQPQTLYLGKLAVDEDQRGKGLATRLVELAEARALACKLPVVELEVRIELTENHRFFNKLGFEKVGEGCHEGFKEPTFIIMQMHLAY